ncbi:MAG: beta-propeller fold lactonase family protein [Bacteroidota bacterium]|nr:beta-propeller fold lactonase family protein [Bacteroidota bacterium]
MRISFKILALISLMFFVSCKTSKIAKSIVTSVVSGEAYHSSYDDTTLAVDNSSILMPYNRFIDPAGTVIRFGNMARENHSLDCVMLPDGNVLAVEDRYGVAFIDVKQNKLLFHLDYAGEYSGLMSTYSGLKSYRDETGEHLLWGAANPYKEVSLILDAVWDGEKAVIKDSISFEAAAPAPLSLPNDIAINEEDGQKYLYVVLNGNNQLQKLRLADKKIIWTTATGMAPFGIALAGSKAYVTNWAGPVPTDKAKETAGIPYGEVYVDHRTGATLEGTISIIDLKTGNAEKEVEVGLHPNAIISSKDGKLVYVSNGNSDNVSVIDTQSDKVIDSVSVRLNPEENHYIGDSPNALALSEDGKTLYVSNGMDNAVAVVNIGEISSSAGEENVKVKGFIPTEAYPAGLALHGNSLYVANLEGEGARTEINNSYNAHHEEATISIIPLPSSNDLDAYTKKVIESNLLFRTKITGLLPRDGIAPKPVPERIGEPSVFKHVLYIIKENRTYDQVLGDMKEGDGQPSLCIYGNNVTPNQHKLAKQYLLLDNYYASGKSSAEGHSWADAAIVTDYIEKNVRAWFRSYPHVLYDAMVYNKNGFIWNNALDHGKTVRIYGEACVPEFNGSLNWTSIYQNYLAGKQTDFTNVTTISRVKPIMSQTYPCYDGHNFNDQMRADAFINELKEAEKKPGDQLPQLMVMALPNDHTAGMAPGFPTPRAMVADNDLALGRIIEAVTKSRFWDSTVVFVSEDDSQDGWDHVSAYRTTGFVISPYSHLQKTVHTNYNQTCVVRTIEQILGLPPMNIMDATALPMFDCFSTASNKHSFSFVKNNVPLNEMNKGTASLSGKAKKFAQFSMLPEFAHIDGGNDDLLNRILWFASKGNTPYPKQLTLPKGDRKDADD